MGKGRLEAFSDATLAIIITIMVLELRPPHDIDPVALRPSLPVLLSYVLSFVFLGLYWNNHHHLLSCTRGGTGAMLWANLHLLYWLWLESADRAAGYWTTRSATDPKVYARTSGVYLRANPDDMSILDGRDDRKRAELIATRLAQWKSSTNA
jgi:hypothetical protein